MKACFFIVIAAAYLAAGHVFAETSAKTIFGANEALVDGSRALLAGDYDVGIRLTLRGLQTEAGQLKRAQALSNLCAGYTGLHEHEKALAACNEALEINGSNWRAFNNRALALIGLGRVSDARADLDAALVLRPGSPKLARTRAWIDAHAPRMLLARE